MTTDEVLACFEQHEDESHKFERIAMPPHPRPDIAAFLILDRLNPKPGHGIICGAEHDQVWLSVQADDLKDATEADIVSLIRCGVWYDDEADGLAMFC